MQIRRVSKSNVTVALTAAERRKLHKIVLHLEPHVSLEARGRYEQLSDAQWWSLLVGQVAVMGGSRGWAKVHKDAAFQREIALDRCRSEADPARYLGDVLRDHGATRFWQKSADKLAAVLGEASVVRGGQVVLGEGLNQHMPRDEIRHTLLSRCSLFKMKSASDFMIGVGLSHDVIAFDARVVGLLKEKFDLEATTAQVQSNRPLYLGLEEALRSACEEVGKPLALLDRAIFQFRGKPEMDVALKTRVP